MATKLGLYGGPKGNGTFSPKAAASAATAINLRYNSLNKDTVYADLDSSGNRVPFSLIWSATPGAASAPIDVVAASGTLNNVKIIILKLK